MRADETLQLLGSEQARGLMVKLYGEKQAEENTERYRQMIEKFKETYGDRDILMFSSPGRTEISGNHTDHNHGKVLAGSINLDCVGIAANMIGVNKRIIIFDNGGKYMVMFNPEIIKKSGPYEAEEGCLSLTGTRKARRWQSIKVRY